MTKLVTDFLEEVSTDLGDPNYDTWAKADLLAYLVEGLGAMIPFVPDQFATDTTVDLIDGAKQPLPFQAIDLVTPVCNLVAGIPGRAIRRVSLLQLDRSSPTWRSATPDATTRGVAYDEANPRFFYVTPPAISGNHIVVSFIIQPSNLELNDDVPVDDVYFDALKNYISFRAYSRDEEYATQSGRAMAHWTAFRVGVGAPVGESK